MLQQAKDTLVVRVSGVKLSFFGGMRFGRVGDPLLTRDGVAQVASLDDLMAHKLKVILQRAEKKDYEDIAAMLDAGISLGHGLAAAKLFFGGAFQAAESLKALTYFKDGDLPRLAKADRNGLIAAAVAIGDLPDVEPRAKALAITV